MQGEAGPVTFVLGDSQQDNDDFLDVLASMVDGSIITAAKCGYSTDMIQRYLGDHLEQLVTDGRAIFPTRWILSCSNDTATDTNHLSIPLTFHNPLNIYLANMARMVHEIHTFCRRHDTHAEMMLIPPVPMNPANMWHINISKGASNLRTIEYAHALGSLARRLHKHYRYESEGSAGGIRGVRFANCWDGMTRAMRDKENPARLFTDGFHLTPAGYQAIAKSWKETGFFKGCQVSEEEGARSIGRLNALLPSAARLRYWKRMPDEAAREEAMEEAYGLQSSDLAIAWSGELAATHFADLYHRALFLWYDTTMPCNDDPPLFFREWQRDHGERYEQVHRVVDETLIGFISEESAFGRHNRVKTEYGQKEEKEPWSAVKGRFSMPHSPRLGAGMYGR